MTPGDRGPDRDAASAGRPAVEVALDAVRRDAEDRWVEVGDRVLAAALTATRRSRPVRALTPGGPVTIADQVLVAYLRPALDAADPGTTVHRVTVGTGEDGALSTLLLEVTATFGTPLLDAADRLRAAAAPVLHDLLGPAAPPVTLHLTHVHVHDIDPPR